MRVRPGSADPADEHSESCVDRRNESQSGAALIARLAGRGPQDPTTKSLTVL